MKTPPALFALLLAALPAAAAPVTFESEDAPATLIELFTSEGCSSCPPAEAWLGRLKTRPDLWKRVVPVAFHVDYWNNLGWPDRFATRAYTARQQRYAAAWRTSSVYTPGLVRDGREWPNWAGELVLPAAVPVGKLRVTLRDRTQAEVTFSPTVPAPKTLQVEIVLLGGGLVTDVPRGENSGRRLQHEFVALSLTTAALTAADGRYTATVALPAKTADPARALAAWVTPGDAQPPLQATGGWLKE
jgi:hypothetical protein